MMNKEVWKRNKRMLSPAFFCIGRGSTECTVDCHLYNLALRDWLGVKAKVFSRFNPDCKPRGYNRDGTPNHKSNREMEEKKNLRGIFLLNLKAHKKVSKFTAELARIGEAQVQLLSVNATLPKLPKWKQS